MVQRYDAGCYYAGQDEMVEATDGSYVTYDDYQKLEAELEELRQQVKAPGWIEWAGGDCPVPKGTLVDVKWSNGDIDSREEAGEWRWSNCMNGPNIIAYRMVKP